MGIDLVLGRGIGFWRRCLSGLGLGYGFGFWRGFGFGLDGRFGACGVLGKLRLGGFGGGRLQLCHPRCIRIALCQRFDLGRGIDGQPLLLAGRLLEGIDQRCLLRGRFDQWQLV